MAKREMIISGFTGKNAEEQVNPFLKNLLGKFVDELKEDEKLLFEYTSVAAMGDLWIAVWDDETFTLSVENPGTQGRGASVSLGYDPEKGPQTLLPALYLLCDADMY